MKLILHFNDYGWDIEPDRYGPALVAMAQAAEAAGFSAIGVADHLWQASQMGGAERPMLETSTVLGLLAAATRRVSLFSMVAGVHFRAPALLAKSVTTLDVISGGRAWLGIGAGHYEEECVGMGVPFPPLRQRFEMLEEAIQICLRLWSGEQGDERPFEGRHYHLGRPLNVPQSLTRPHPPILIAGDGERKTLPLVARYADACNLRPGPQIPAKIELLRRLCEAEGRDFDAIERTAPTFFDPGDDGAGVPQLLEQLRWFASLGVQTVIGSVKGGERITPIEIMGREVIPAVAEL